MGALSYGLPPMFYLNVLGHFKLFLWSHFLRPLLGLSYAPTSQIISPMHHHPDSIPYVSVRPCGVSFFNLPQGRASRSAAQQEAEKHLEDNDHDGKISAKARRRISHGIDWLLYLAKEKEFTHFKYKRKYKFRVNFVTLTLSSKQVHSDQFIKSKLLNQFLVEGRKKWGIEHYVWRAEPQKNGNIHFHILCDKYIPWSEIRNTWNRIQDKEGYLQRSKHYRAGWTPNSTDVHSIRKVHNLSAYLAKYCTKQSSVRKIEGRQWGLSQSLSRMKSAVETRGGEENEDLSKLFRMKKEAMKEYDYHTVYWVSSEELRECGCDRLIEILDEYVSEMIE